MLLRMPDLIHSASSGSSCGYPRSLEGGGPVHEASFLPKELIEADTALASLSFLQNGLVPLQQRIFLESRILHSVGELVRQLVGNGMTWRVMKPCIDSC